MSATMLFAEHALLPSGWARTVLLEWNAAGQWSHITTDTAAPAGVPQALYSIAFPTWA